MAPLADAEALFAAHQSGLLRYLSRAVGHSDTARDLTQDVFLRIAGSQAADGLVDVDIDTNRAIFGLDRPDKPYDSGLPAARKTLTLKADETTAIDFPPPSSGYAMLTLGDRGTTSGVGMGARASGSPAAQVTEWRDPLTVSRGQLVLNTSQFFRGHRTQLLVRLRRLR